MSLPNQCPRCSVPAHWVPTEAESAVFGRIYSCHVCGYHVGEDDFKLNVTIQPGPTRPCAYDSCGGTADGMGRSAYGGLTWRCRRCLKTFYTDGGNQPTTNIRPSRELLHMQTAFLWAQRSLCSSGYKVGAVITSWDLKRIISIGYNGPGPKLPDDYCQRWRDSAGKSIETGLTRCPCLHAEDNAFLLANDEAKGGVLFTTMAPCLLCSQRAARKGIARVIYSIGYRDPSGIDLLRQMGIEVEQMPLGNVVDQHRITPSGAMLCSTLKPVASVPITVPVSFAGPTTRSGANTDS